MKLMFNSKDILQLFFQAAFLQVQSLSLFGEKVPTPSDIAPISRPFN